MNSDTPQPGQSPASPTPTPPRSSNLKGRWKRGPNPVTGAIVQPRPTTPASCGVVTDVASAKESLSGSHAKGYEAPAPASAPASVSISTPIPVVTQAAPAPAPRTESFTPRPAAPSALTPRPGTFNPPQHRQSSQAPRSDAPPSRPPQQPRPSQPSRPPQDNRGGQQDNRSGEREHFVALKPDPANDAAPRRLRTESSRPVPVEEYSPSNFGKVPDKSIPAKSDRQPSDRERHSDRDRHSPKERHSERRESAPASSSGERPKPNATISARVPSSKDGKGKSGGIFGFIKKIFGDSSKDRKAEKAPVASHEPEPDDRDGKDEGDGREHRSHHRSGQNRHGDSRRGGHRRSDRR